MKQITKKELFELITESLRENCNYCGDDKFKYIHLNGITIYYTHYKACKDSLGDDDFYIYFFDNDGICCIYRSYEMEYTYFDYTMYEII